MIDSPESTWPVRLVTLWWPVAENIRHIFSMSENIFNFPLHLLPLPRSVPSLKVFPFHKFKLFGIIALTFAWKHAEVLFLMLQLRDCQEESSQGIRNNDSNLMLCERNFIRTGHSKIASPRLKILLAHNAVKCLNSLDVTKDVFIYINRMRCWLPTQAAQHFYVKRTWIVLHFMVSDDRGLVDFWSRWKTTRTDADMTSTNAFSSFVNNAFQMLT